MKFSTSRQIKQNQTKNMGIVGKIRTTKQNKAKISFSWPCYYWLWDEVHFATKSPNKEKTGFVPKILNIIV